MAPFNLNGLNVVQHDAQDTPAPSPDFSAHLDLWTNLTFESDEPLATKRKFSDNVDDDNDNNNTTPPPLGLPNQDSHENAVLPPTAPSSDDINALLVGFGLDPLLIPTAPPAPPIPSLAQLLALHATYSGAYALPPSATSASAPVPPSKRTHTQKPSPDNTDTLTSTSTPQSPEETTQSDPKSVAEDKRRRNTAASARFRLKKKEREAALERRAKELEDRVAELERECEGLRRENGWLKGLVIGVTGAGATQQQATKN